MPKLNAYKSRSWLIRKWPAINNGNKGSYKLWGCHHIIIENFSLGSKRVQTTLHQLTVERNFTYGTVHERDLVSRIAQQCQNITFRLFQPCSCCNFAFQRWRTCQQKLHVLAIRWKTFICSQLQCPWKFKDWLLIYAGRRS